jgi:hypothetical protein
MYEDSTDVRVLLLAQYAGEPLIEQLAVQMLRETVRVHVQCQIGRSRHQIDKANNEVVLERCRRRLADDERVWSDLNLGLEGDAEVEYCKALVATRRGTAKVTQTGQDDT